MRAWLAKRSVPRYAFLVLWFLFMEQRITTDAANHWPRASVAGYSCGVIGLLIVAILYFAQKSRRTS